MVKNFYAASESAAQRLNVQLAGTPTILTVVWPASPRRAGEIIADLNVLISNMGADGKCICWVVDNANGMMLAVIEQDILSGGQAYFQPTWPMLGKDTTIRIQAGNQQFITDTYWTVKTIELLVDVNTKIVNFNLDRTFANPGAAVGFVGTLQRADTSVGLQGARVYIRAGSADFANALTDGNGTFQGSFPAPETAGAYDMKAVFGGAQLGGLTYGPSVSSLSRLAVGTVFPRTLLLQAGMGLGFGAAGYYSQRRENTERKIAASLGLGLVGVIAGTVIDKYLPA